MGRRASITPKLRRRVMKRDKGRCSYCGKKAGTVDHVLPLTLGGSDAYANLIAACRKCNNRKNGRTPAQANMPFTLGDALTEGWKKGSAVADLQKLIEYEVEAAYMRGYEDGRDGAWETVRGAMRTHRAVKRRGEVPLEVSGEDTTLVEKVVANVNGATTAGDLAERFGIAWGATREQIRKALYHAYYKGDLRRVKTGVYAKGEK